MVPGDLGGDLGEGDRLEAPDLQQLEPATPASRGKDYILTPSEIDAIAKSPAQRFDANLAAIRLVKQLEQEDRPATPEEQKVLALYSGFGDSAFSPAFNKYGYNVEPAWKRRGEELRALTTREEYEAIEGSRLNAFYTTPEVIQTVWSALERMGAADLPHLRVLEPSAGAGRFLGLQPVELAARSQRTAVELDPMTGKMLRHLYPNADVYAGLGFEKAPLPDNHFDIAISNVPFGDYGVVDPTFRKEKAPLTQYIHNYFFAKSLDKLRPGGMLAFVTSHGTLDAPTQRHVREYLAEHADLVAAYRLPTRAFPDTEVVTDIIFLRKRAPGDPPGDTRWLDTTVLSLEGPDGYGTYPHPVNNYFIEHPEHVLGKHNAKGKMRRYGEYGVEAPADAPLGAAMRKTLAGLPSGVITRPTASAPGATAPSGESRAVLKGHYVIGDDGSLMVQSGGTFAQANLSADQEARVKGMLAIRDAARAAMAAQVEDKPQEEIERTRETLTAAYDAYVKKYGPLGAQANEILMRRHPDGPLLRALERWPNDKEKKRELYRAKTLTQADADAIKMPLFSQRVLRGLGKRNVTNAKDAMVVAFNETGRLDLARIGELLGRNPDSVRVELAAQRLIFRNPVGDWEIADQYLSGDVREKLRQAERAAAANPTYRVNVDALRAVQPEDLPPSQIDVQLGAPWVPDSDINEFVKHLLSARERYHRYRYGEPERPTMYGYVPETGEWVLHEKYDASNAKLTSEWGTERMPADQLIIRLLNSKQVEVMDPDPGDPQGKRKVRNVQETAAAQEKARKIQEEFQRWLWSDPDRAERLARKYNDTFNNIRPRRFDGSHIQLPGMTEQWRKQLHPHQKDAIWRVVQDGTALLAHEVGFGKSAEMVASGMELKRLGLTRKVLYVVPKATHAQFRDQFFDIYPNANVLFPDDEDFTPAKRPEFLSRAATGDWDAIIVSDSQFRKIPLTPETEIAFLKDELRQYRAALEAQKDPRTGRVVNEKTHKAIQDSIKKREAKLGKLQAKIAEGTDKTIHFEDLGVDQLFVDEADMFKNLPFATSMERIKGLPNSESERAWDMYQKVRYLQKRGGGRGVVFATGTPIANTVAEAWTMMRYLQEPELEKRGLQHFDAWAKTFGSTTEALEQTPAGTFRITQRFSKFANIPELSHLWQQTADIRVVSETPEMTKRQPRIVNEKGQEGRTVIVAKADQHLKDYMQSLIERVNQLPGKDPREDNMLKIANDARMASLDVRMVDPDARENPEGKVALAARKIADIYKETAADRGTQLVFLDLGTPKAVDKVNDESETDDADASDSETEEEAQKLRNVYGAIRAKLVAAGVPEDHIAFIHDAKNNKQRLELFERVNNGDVRVLIGSTGKMGAGVNVQRRAAALHHIDAPWRPRDIEQREGRIVRQGNEVYGPKFDEHGAMTDPGRGVQIFTYVTDNSFDGFMWQSIEAKAKAIKSLMRRTPTARAIEDADTFVLSASEAKALASGDPTVMKAVRLKNDITKLQLAQAGHRDEQFRAQERARFLPKRISALQDNLARMKQDHARADRIESTAVTIYGKTIKERTDAGEAVRAAMLAVKSGEVGDQGKDIGATYKGFSLRVLPAAAKEANSYQVLLYSTATGALYPTTVMPSDISPTGVMQRLENAVKDIHARAERTAREISDLESSLKTYEEQAGRPFEHHARLAEMQAELARLEKELQEKTDQARGPQPTGTRASGAGPEAGTGDNGWSLDDLNNITEPDPEDMQGGFSETRFSDRRRITQRDLDRGFSPGRR